MIKALSSLLLLPMLSGLGYAKAPKLALQVTADGLRADLIERYANHYGKNGEKTWNRRRSKQPCRPQRADDIYVYQKPNWFMYDRGPIGAMHGSPYSYDTHVPLIFAGGGIKPQAVGRPVHPIDVAPTLSALLGITALALAQGVPLAEMVQWPSIIRES